MVGGLGGPRIQGGSQLEEGCPLSKKVLLSRGGVLLHPGRPGWCLPRGLLLLVTSITRHLCSLHPGPVGWGWTRLGGAPALLTLGGVVPPVAGGALDALGVLMVLLALPSKHHIQLQRLGLQLLELQVHAHPKKLLDLLVGQAVYVQQLDPKRGHLTGGSCSLPGELLVVLNQIPSLLLEALECPHMRGHLPPKVCQQLLT